MAQNITDVLIKDGDIVLDSSGNTVMLSGIDAKFQRAMLCIKAKRGKFIYNRELGSHLDDVLASKNSSAQRAELEINEALAGFDNTFARVSQCGEQLVVELNIDGEIRFLEVQ